MIFIYSNIFFELFKFWLSKYKVYLFIFTISKIYQSFQVCHNFKRSKLGYRPTKKVWEPLGYSLYKNSMLV